MKTRILSNPLTFMFASLIVVALIVSVLFQASAQDATGELKEHLMNPYVLFGLMVFGSILSAAKQWSVAKMDGTAPTISNYLSHLQELFITLGGNTLAFVLLVDSGNLNVISAISIGYVINSAADLNPLGKRSDSLK